MAPLLRIDRPPAALDPTRRRPEAPGAGGFDTILAMEASRPAPFEVYCDRCRVTFPVGTRRCVHCGGPTGGSPGRVAMRFEQVGEPELAEPEVETEPGRRRMVSPLTLVWIVLIVAGYAIRACSGQAP
jgi:hypothetical protein